MQLLLPGGGCFGGPPTLRKLRALTGQPCCHLPTPQHSLGQLCAAGLAVLQHS